VSQDVAVERWRLEVAGVVQGVGFRPFVHRLATELGLTGLVGNDSAQVFIEVQGDPPMLERFVSMLRAEAPPLAVIETVDLAACAVLADDSFVIVASRPSDGAGTFVPPDVAVCHDCLTEMRDSSDRRYRHPFITCTNCGPRFTIIRALPYDRPLTTMRDLPMCERCAAEYQDPMNRRFHAQPIACNDCGPTLTLVRPGARADGDDERITGDDAIHQARDLIASGGIVAVKGIGGYHLVCAAADESAVTKLRRRKGRGDKPFAVMVADLVAASALADVNVDEAAQLELPANPIVLLRRRDGSDLSDAVAPGTPLVGVMLPPSGLHHLLIDDIGTPLVVTSGNLSGEPIAHRDDDAVRRLDRIADAFLLHDRPINVPCDDSVVRVVDAAVMPIRRSRGFAPLPVSMPSSEPVLATGADLKNTFCIAAGGRAWISQHIGDMANLETLDAFEASVRHFVDFYGIEPGRVVVDAHPGYLVGSWARRTYPGLVMEVQHHHAHVAAVLAEHHRSVTETVIGMAFDGTGFGSDGAIWGGEVLIAGARSCRRVGHLRYVPLPGGDAALRQPARVALAHLRSAGVPWSGDIASVAAVTAAEQALLDRQLATGFRCVPTSSMGRLFDAVSSLLGIRHEATYEAQAAIELEAAAESHDGDCPRYRFTADGEQWDAGPVIRSIVTDIRAGVPRDAIAAGFHHAVAGFVADAATEAARSGGPTTVALSGGVFQNALLFRLSRSRLETCGLEVLTHRVVPANDGGLSLGQAFIAAGLPGAGEAH
jgi:hydrogenase maturation protein HypF